MSRTRTKPPDLDAIRARAEEAFLVGSHGTASGVWFADVTEEDVREDARNTLALLAEIERLRAREEELKVLLQQWLDLPLAVNGEVGLLRAEEAHRTKEPSECAPDGDQAT